MKSVDPQTADNETATPPAEEPQADIIAGEATEAAPAETGSVDDASGEVEACSRRRGVVLAVVGVATVLIGAFGIFAAIASHSLRSAAASANSALVDRAATKAVEADVTRAVQTIFSYNYADTGRTKAAAQRLLTGQAIRQYDQLFALVQREAPKEKLVVTTKVTDIGVELLTGDRARLLVFANQQDTRAGTSQASFSGAMFAVTAVRAGTGWKIESIDTFTSPSG